LLRKLKRAGFLTATFGYFVSQETVSQIVERLVAKLRALLAIEDLVLIGHSLGGVLLRHALGMLGETRHRVHHLFLLGSPVTPSRLAVRLSGNWIFRAVTQDCGQLLASPARMLAIAPSEVPTTGIAGTRGFTGGGLFGTEPNDGVVTVSEVSAPWLQNQVLVPVMHTLLPSSATVAEAILKELGCA